MPVIARAALACSVVVAAIACKSSHDVPTPAPATVKTAKAALPAVPSLDVPRVPSGLRVELDGVVAEPAWKAAAKTGKFVDVRTGKPNDSGPVQGEAWLLWDDDALYVAFSVSDRDVVGGFDTRATDPHLWTRDTVELMIDPDGDGDNRDYYEIQINPQNLVFDSRFDTYNRPRPTPRGPFGHEGWSANLQSAVRVHGSLGDGGSSEADDTGYFVEARIPWTSFARAKHAPPRPGDEWRANLYAMQNNGGVAWSPILGQGNFHKASRFGRLRWVVGR